jgi:hypothetical protein
VNIYDNIVHKKEQQRPVWKAKYNAILEKATIIAGDLNGYSTV